MRAVSVKKIRYRKMNNIQGKQRIYQSCLQKAFFKEFEYMYLS